MKKRISILICVLLIVTNGTMVFADNNPWQINDFGTYYERPEVEIQTELEAMAAQQLAMYNIIVPFGGHAPLAQETRTVFHYDKTKYTDKDALAGNQLEGGYKANGYLYYDTGGGSSYSVAVTFGAPWANVSVSGTTGVKRGSVGGIAVELPDAQNYYKLRATKTYKSVPYELQIRNIGETTWRTFSYGVASTYYSVYVYPAKVQ